MMSKVNENFTVKDKSTVAYLQLVTDFISSFENFKFVQIPCLKNAYANAISKFTISSDFELLKIVPIEHS